MASNAYLDRLQENEQSRTQQNQQTLATATGLPISRPSTGDTSPSGVPTGKPPIPQDDESYKNTTFYQNFAHHQGQDPHFDGMVGELTKLATGLRQQVNNGYMPPIIAEKRIHQFVNDSVAHFERKAGQFAKENAEADKQQRMQAIMGALSQASQQQAPQQDMPAEGVSPEEAQSGNYAPPQGGQ